MEMEKYLQIITENNENNKNLVRTSVIESLIENNIYFGNVSVGNNYIYEDGTQWIKILENKNTYWKIEQGFAGDAIGNKIDVKKSEVSTLLRDNKIYQENNKLSIINENNNAYEIFLEKTDRYLLKNYQLESSNIKIDWKSLFEDGYSPSDAAEYALLRG